MDLHEPVTPFAVLDADKVATNVARLRGRLAGTGVPLRLHVKTAKSVEVALMAFDGTPGPIAVSTLAEAEAFAAAGFTDIVYAVGIAPDKLTRVADLRERGVDLVVLLDSVAQASAAAKAAVPALIEIDSDGHRAGLAPDDPAVLEIAGILPEVRGVLTHAGRSYYAYTPEEKHRVAADEVAHAVRVAERLRAAGYAAPVVSIGSTPSGHTPVELTGVTEARIGNFVFLDLVMAGLGVCAVEDLALSVVATVIGHQRDKGWILTDGGWMATSQDRSTAQQKIDQGYGLVTDLDGVPYPDLLMSAASQEHGVLSVRPGSAAELPDLPVGARVRILPNHACATAAQHDRYHVIGTGSRTVRAVWPRVRGW
ncbi:alanine racemase [Virgisporangium aliadipatigenens]|uniref:Alanine racemase n=1 Tax=Virgisporangium aliadipatigenens TaxID=741659 RepID=A0A8J4DNR5_9ACTN|nr:alanine racemase [Virgisporangium aliadipatigenens]GIJ45175.1 alanine racemase [Virgisporangium aliadipatigenens]